MRVLTGFAAFVALAVFSPVVRADVLFDLRLSEAKGGRCDRDVFNDGFAGEADFDRTDFRASGDQAIRGEWLMSHSVRVPEVVRLPKSLPQLIAASKGITPIPVKETDVVAISTFSQFVQLFKSTTGAEKDTTERVSEIARGILPKASHMTLIGLLVFSFAGMCSVVGMNRIGVFGRTACQ